MWIDEARLGKEFDEGIAKARRLARSGDGAAAIAAANDVIAKYPGEIEGWLVRALVHELDDEYNTAAADITSAIALNSFEPHLYYSRGRYYFHLGDDAAAIGDFSRALSLCDFHKNDYYREELLFWRAEALLRLGRKEEALDDISGVSDEFNSWTDKPRSKHDLLRECAPLSYATGGGLAAAKPPSSR